MFTHSQHHNGTAVVSANYFTLQSCNVSCFALQGPTSSPVMCADLLVAPFRHELGGTWSSAFPQNQASGPPALHGQGQHQCSWYCSQVTVRLITENDAPHNKNKTFLLMAFEKDQMLNLQSKYYACGLNPSTVSGQRRMKLQTTRGTRTGWMSVWTGCLKSGTTKLMKRSAWRTGERYISL